MDGHPLDRHGEPGVNPTLLKHPPPPFILEICFIYLQFVSVNGTLFWFLVSFSFSFSSVLTSDEVTISMQTEMVDSGPEE